MLPYALYLGMPEELFWKSTPKKLMPYAKAHADRVKEAEYIAWVQGLHFKAALFGGFLAVDGITDKRHHLVDYPDNPYEIAARKEMEKNQQYIENEKLRAQIFFHNLADRYKQNHKKE